MPVCSNFYQGLIFSPFFSPVKRIFCANGQLKIPEIDLTHPFQQADVNGLEGALLLPGQAVCRKKNVFEVQMLGLSVRLSKAWVTQRSQNTG